MSKSDIINVSVSSKSNVVKRKDVQKGDVFYQHGGKDKTPRAALGRREIPPSKDARFMSMNLLTGEESSTANGEVSVTIIGRWTLQVDIQEEYKHLFSDGKTKSKRD